MNAGTARSATQNQTTGFCTAVSSGSLSTVKSLLSKGQDVNAVGSNGFAALLSAALKGDHSMCQLLISWGANVNAASGRTAASLGYTALYGAAEYGHTDVCNDLTGRRSQRECAE